MIWLNSLLFISSCFSCCNAAGVLAHADIQRRANYFFSLPRSGTNLAGTESTPLARWMTQYVDFTQAGSFFPDWGYGCLAGDEASEIAHWPPFLGAAERHLITKYTLLDSSLPGQ